MHCDVRLFSFAQGFRWTGGLGPLIDIPAAAVFQIAARMSEMISGVVLERSRRSLPLTGGTRAFSLSLRAKRSNPWHGKRRGGLLRSARNDVDTVSHSRGIHCARGLLENFPPSCQRAQGRPGARCTRGPVCNCAQKTRTRAYRYRRNIPAFPAQWLYGLLRALPGERLFCHRRPQEAASHGLDASTATSGPHDFAVRIEPHVSRSSRVHRIPPHVRDDRHRPSHRVRRAELWG